MSANIIIGADLVPTKSNFEYFIKGNIEQLIGKELVYELKQADFTIFNLEVPLTDNETPIVKCGPNLSAPTDTIVGLSVINPYFFTLANNHILDQGKQGLLSTIDVLKKANISYAGVGENINEATTPFIKNINGIMVGIYCCAEHEFSIATETECGANPFNPLESLDHILLLKEKCDYVICLYHGGKEHYRYPSPNLQKICRKIVDKGADLVVCQHSHCIGAHEEWGTGNIVYGQGNFLFDDCDDECWKTSLLINLKISRDNNELKSKINFIPLEKQREKVRLSTDKRILENFYNRSKSIEDIQCVKEMYDEFAENTIYNYLSALEGNKNNSLLVRGLNKLLCHRFTKWRLKRIYGGKENLCIQNFIECEAHRELLIQGLKIQRK